MKLEQVYAIQKQTAVVSAEQAKLGELWRKGTESPEVFAKLSLEQKFDRMYLEVSDMLDDIAHRQPGDLHGYTPALRIPYQHGSEQIDLKLRFEVHEDRFSEGRHIEANWFANYTGLPSLSEEVSEKQVKEVEKRATNTYYQEKIKREFANFEWSIIQYQEAISRLSYEELCALHFTPEFIRSLDTAVEA